VNPDFIRRNVAAQKADPDSLFTFTKKLLRLRKEFSALRHGEFVPLETGHGILAYLRTTNEQTVLVALNFRGNSLRFTPPEGKWQALITDNGDPAIATTQLAPYEVRLLFRGKQK
jgi:glycosidase